MFQEPGVRYYLCRQCSTTFAFTDQLVSNDIVMEAAFLTDVKKGFYDLENDKEWKDDSRIYHHFAEEDWMTGR
ncbi:hypothetical protein ACSBR1_019065 [Camellia fascicularis]